MGSLPADSEQFMLIEHLSEQLAKLQEQIDEGRAPHDQQQKLTFQLMPIFMKLLVLPIFTMAMSRRQPQINPILSHPLMT